MKNLTHKQKVDRISLVAVIVAATVLISFCTLVAIHHVNLHGIYWY